MGGITTATSTNLLYGTDGYVTVNGTDLGATIGNIEIEWSLTQSYPDLAQARGPVMGTGRVTDARFSCKVTITEWTYSVFSKFIGSWGYSTDASSEKIGGGSLKDVSEISNIVVTGITRNDGKAFKVTIPQAYVEVGNISLSEKEPTTLELTFIGLFTTSSPTTLPGYFQFAK